MPIDFSYYSIEKRAKVYRDLFGEFTDEQRKFLKLMLKVLFDNKGLIDFARSISLEQINFWIEYIDLIPKIIEVPRLILSQFLIFWKFLFIIMDCKSISKLLFSIIDLVKILEFSSILEKVEICAQNIKKLIVGKEKIDKFGLGKITKVKYFYKESSLIIEKINLKINLILNCFDTNKSCKLEFALKDS